MKIFNILQIFNAINKFAVIISIAFIFTIFGRVEISAYTPKDSFKKGNELFNAGQYQGAAEIYNTLLDSGYHESEIYYNLANTYFRMDKIPLAILNYERARKLNPGDDDINFNLKLANLRIVDKFEAVPKLFIYEWYEKTVRLFYSGVWGYIAVISSWVFFITLIFLFYSRLANVRKFMVTLAFISLLLLVVSGILGYKAYQFENATNEAIIFNPSVYVKSAPDPGSTDLFILHDGTKVIITESIDNWIQIRVENGDIGWIKQNEVEII
jgi:tetratricopeptide (TPR) repeat protein